MTEIPEHLLKRAQEARERAGCGSPVPADEEKEEDEEGEDPGLGGLERLRVVGFEIEAQERLGLEGRHQVPDPALGPRDARGVEEGPQLLGAVEPRVARLGAGHVDTARAVAIPLIVTPATVSWENVLIDEITDTEKTIYLAKEAARELGRAMRCPDQVPVFRPGKDAHDRLIGACNYNLFYRQQDERFWVKP